MRGTLKIDHQKKRIVMNATFEKYSKVCTSDEFAYLMDIKTAFPNYKVITMKAKTNPNANKHEGLNYNFMKWYIRHNSPKEKADEEIEIINVAKALSTRQDGTYGKVKSWFLENHDELRDKETSEKAQKLYTVSVWETEAQKTKQETSDKSKVKALVANNQTVDEVLLGKAG